VVAGALAWVAVVGLARGVALPERCPPASVAEVRASAEEAVGWFGRNQQADGRWVYRYDRAADEVDRRPHVVRQAGITLSLYQAHAAGVDGALAPADAGVDWLLGEVVEHDGWSAVRRGDLAPTGASALLVAGLATRRAATDDPRYDDEMDALGRFLVAMTEPSGAVGANWDIPARRPVPGDRSPYFTGEAYLGLGLLAAADPTGGWEPGAARIGRYLATERDRAEDRFPPTSDHWAAYGLAQAATTGGVLDGDHLAYAERLAGIFSVQVRYESQRTDSGLNRRLLRGPQVLGAGLGTLGEGLGSLWTVARHDDGLAGRRAAIAERVRCVAGMLVDRQVGTAEADDAGTPGLARGAWFHADVTQMDDQQHALSALLLAEPVVAETGLARPGAGSTDGPWAWRVVWLAVVALAAVNPARVRRLVGHLPAGAVAAEAAGPGLDRGAVAAGAVGSGLAVGLVAVAAGPLLRAADVSPSTALVAAGLVVALAAVVDAVARRPAPLARWGPGGGALVPLAVPALVRPAVTVLAVAVAADGGVIAGIAVTVAVAAAGASILLPLPSRPPSPLRERVDRAEREEEPAEPEERNGRGNRDEGPAEPEERNGREGRGEQDESAVSDGRRLLIGDAATWAFAAVALVGAVDLVAHGVFSV
jgi:hypothetical protein